MHGITTTVTSKGQVTIPKEVREIMHIEKGEKLHVTVEGRALVMRPVIKEPLKELVKLREKISFTQADLNKMIKESKKDWEKF